MKKDFIINLVFKILIKGIAKFKDVDAETKADILQFPNNFVVEFRVFPNVSYTKFKINNGEILFTNAKPNLIIEFKDSKIAKQICLGKLGVADAFSMHKVIVKGDITYAVVLTRIINKLEYYLFPRFITIKFLPKYPKQKINIFALYCKILFGRVKYEK